MITRRRGSSVPRPIEVEKGKVGAKQVRILTKEEEANLIEVNMQLPVTKYPGVGGRPMTITLEKEDYSNYIPNKDEN